MNKINNKYLIIIYGCKARQLQSFWNQIQLLDYVRYGIDENRNAYSD